MTSSDLSIAVSSTQKQITVRAILLDTVEVANGEAAHRLQSLSSAVRPANALDVVVLVHGGLSDPNAGFPSIVQLQVLYGALAMVRSHLKYSCRLLDHPSVVSLPVFSADEITPTLEMLVSRLKEPLDEGPARPSVWQQLIAHATTAAPIRPLTEHQTHILTSLFPSVKEIEKGTRTTEGQAKIRSYLDPGTAEDIIDFWEDERIV